jgi:hypothetical protein
MKRMASPANLAIMGGLFALNVALKIPLFDAGETRYRDSIEGGYASMAHIHLKYRGTPEQYGMAGLSLIVWAGSIVGASRNL